MKKLLANVLGVAADVATTAASVTVGIMVGKKVGNAVADGSGCEELGTGVGVGVGLAAYQASEVLLGNAAEFIGNKINSKIEIEEDDEFVPEDEFSDDVIIIEEEIETEGETPAEESKEEK